LEHKTSNPPASFIWSLPLPDLPRQTWNGVAQQSLWRPGVVPDPGPSIAPLVFSTPGHMRLAHAASMCCLRFPLQHEFQEPHITYNNEGEKKIQEWKKCMVLKRNRIRIRTVKDKHKIYMVQKGTKFNSQIIISCWNKEETKFSTTCPQI
jgi:hypothetical protein